MDTLTQETLQKVQSVDIEQLRKAPITSIDYITEKIEYDVFFSRYLLPNRPCLFGPRVTANWRSVKEWVTRDGQPYLHFLADKFGDTIVPVADCNRVQYYAQPKREMKFGEYLEYWKDHIKKDHNSKDGCLYLKDWHFVHVFPDYQAYKTPVFFTSDWLNEFWDSRSDRADDDYRFVYMGPKGSWTPFHADVFRSFSWSANICGRKKWLLYPPGEEEHLKDHLGNLAYDVTSSEMHDGKKCPNYEKACQPFEVVQEAGEVIFVPSGWHHQVFNLEDTISINHNWLNGCNLDIMWGFLQQELCSVQKSISDCIDMEGWHSQCQLIMKASTGIDYAEFVLFLHLIATQRLKLLTKSSKNDSSPDDHSNIISKRLKDRGMYLIDTSETKHKCELPTQSGDYNEDNHDIIADEKKTERTAGEATSSRTEQSLSGRENIQDVTSRTSAFQNETDLFFQTLNHEHGVWHAVYDLQQIKTVLESLMNNEEFQELDSATLCDDPKKLYGEICQVLKEYM